jgi:dihydrofolate reductase
MGVPHAQRPQDVRRERWRRRHRRRPHCPGRPGSRHQVTFVTDGIEVALERARQAAAGADIRVGGGAATAQQYLKAGLIDELHIPIVPILLGSGERLFDAELGDLDGYQAVEFVASDAVAHVRFERTAG